MDMQRRNLAMALAASAGLVAAAAAGSASAASGPHPHIRAAIAALRDARQELVSAANDFGGHRAAAIQALDGAIAQLQTCLQY